MPLSCLNPADSDNQKKKHKLPENLIMNLTGRKRNCGSFTVTEKFKSALHFNTAFGHTVSILYVNPCSQKSQLYNSIFVKLSHVNYINVVIMTFEGAISFI